MPLNVPKKTKLFVELGEREKDMFKHMHIQFQKDLVRIRLKTAQTYAGLLSDGNAPMSYAMGSQIRLNARHEGIGPVFILKLQL